MVASMRWPLACALLLSRAAAADGLTDDELAKLSEEQAETIEVKSEAPTEAIGAAKLERADIERLPGASNDVMKTLQAMPGVVAYPLPIGQSGVVIRGSSPYDSKVLIDDFEVPALYHDIAFRSIVPAESIDTLEYLPGGFGVAYGRAASGVVSLTTRAGAKERAQQAEIGGSDASVLVQGPLGGATYMLALRRSMVDLLIPYVLPDGLDLSLTTVPRYYDEQLRIDYAPSSRWKLRLSSLGSDDALELYASKDKNPDKRFLSRTRFIRTTAAATYHEDEWTANLALSGLAQQVVFERGELQHLDDRAPSVTGRAELLRSSPGVLWRIGGETVVTEHAIDVAMPRQGVEGEPMEDDAMDTSETYRGTVETKDVAAWTSVTSDLDERVRVTGGLRVDGYLRNRDAAVQPRGEVTMKITPTLTARVAAGLYTRPPEHQLEVLDASLRAERARQVVAGVALAPADGVKIDASAYYTDRKDLLVREMDGSLGNLGRGTTYGAELLGIVKRGPYVAWLSYAYSHSTRIDGPGETERLFDYDQPHSLSAAGSYRRGKWTFGARFRLSSGLPATPVDAAVFDSDANRYVPLYGETNSDRAELHHQLDLRIDKTWMWGPVKMTKFLDVQNVYMNDSVVGYFYGFDYTQRAAFRSLPILPTAGLRGEW